MTTTTVPSSAANGLKYLKLDNFNTLCDQLNDEDVQLTQNVMSFFSNGEASEDTVKPIDGILTSEKDGMESEVTLRYSNSLVVTRFN